MASRWVSFNPGNDRSLDFSLVPTDVSKLLWGNDVSVAALRLIIQTRQTCLVLVGSYHSR